MSVTSRDKETLRELARQIAEIAALPSQQETISLWKALNSLKPVRPMVMIDQVPWHEMDVDDELALQTEDGFCRSLETGMRRTLYSWKHMRADMVIEPAIDIPKVIHGTGFGIRIVEDTAAIDPDNDIVGHLYTDQLKTEEDLEKIQYPEVGLDAQATARNEEMARDLFDDILTVRMQGVIPNFAIWDRIIMWRGAEAALWDLADRPDFTHQIVARTADVHVCLLDQLEEQNLLGSHQGTIHCSGAYTDELPAPGHEPGKTRARDLWTCGMAQIFSTVSPAMHQEYELEYANPYYARFGLVYYGCCEPLDDKISIIRNTPNVRKISMSPWVNEDKGAEQMAGDFVYSRKPSPAFLVEDRFDADRVRDDLVATRDTCACHSTPCELILKDISTVRYEPQRLWEWEDVAMGVVGASR